jgi:hypothetical protein
MTRRRRTRWVLIAVRVVAAQADVRPSTTTAGSKQPCARRQACCTGDGEAVEGHPGGQEAGQRRQLAGWPPQGVLHQRCTAAADIRLPGGLHILMSCVLGRSQLSAQRTSKHSLRIQTCPIVGLRVYKWKSWMMRESCSANTASLHQHVAPKMWYGQGGMCLVLQAELLQDTQAAKTLVHPWERCTSPVCCMVPGQVHAGRGDAAVAHRPKCVVCGDARGRACEVSRCAALRPQVPGQARTCEKHPLASLVPMRLP